MNVDLVVLNFNGRGLLEQCLPSIIEAASISQHDCRVVVVDNASSDNSVAYLREKFPEIHVKRCKNRGLCSYNTVLAKLESEIAVLLNNDIRLESNAVDPLIAPLVARGVQTGGRCYMTAPRCESWGTGNYEGQKTAVRWRCGLVEATSLYEQHEQYTHLAGRTATAGAAMAIDRRVFLELDGFDSLYLPGRLEDLDLAFRAHQRGYVAEYVPQSVAYHAGQATFAREFGAAGCHHLALRNTLLFQWKNLRCRDHLLRQAGGYAARAVRDVVTAPFQTRQQRWRFIRAWFEASKRWHVRRRSHAVNPARTEESLLREREFFRDFHPLRIDALEISGPLTDPLSLERNPVQADESTNATPACTSFSGEALSYEAP